MHSYVVIQDKSLQYFLDNNFNWTKDIGEARKFPTRTEAKRLMQHRGIDGYDVFIDKKGEKIA